MRDKHTRPVAPAVASGFPRHRLAAALLVILGAALRLPALDRIPPGLHFDEAVYGLMARDIIAGARPVFFPAYTGREPLYMYLMAGVFSIAGDGIWAIRLTSALVGSATVAAAYSLGRALHGRWVGLTAAGLLATNYWHVTVSRNGYPNVLIPPLEALSAFFLWRAWRHEAGGRAADWLLGGAFAGLVLYTYLAARFWPVLLLLFLAYLAVGDRPAVRRKVRGLMMAAAAAAIVFLPLGLHFQRHPGDFTQRADQVLAWRQTAGLDLVRALVRNFVATARGAVGSGDPRWHYNLPGRAMLQPWLAVFFAAGVLCSARRWREPRFALPLLWLIVLALPGVLTLEMQPAGQRIFGVHPALTLVVAVGVAGVFRGLATLARVLGVGRCGSLRADDRLSAAGVRVRSRAVAGLPGADRALVVTVCCLMALDASATVRDYFGRWAPSPQVAHAFHADYAVMAAMARADLAAGRTVVLLSEHYKHPTVAFLAPETVDEAVWADPLLALPLPVPRLGTLAGGAGAPVVYYRLAASLAGSTRAFAWLDARATQVRRVRVAGGFTDGDRLVEPVVYRYSVPRDAPDASVPTGRATAIGGEISAWPAAVVQSAPRNEVLVVPVQWRVEHAVQGGRALALHLRDAAGVTWAQADQTGYLAEQWRGGDRVIQWFSLVLDRTMPPGDYVAHLVLADEDAQPVTAGGQPGSAPVADIRVLPEGRRRADDGAQPVGRLGGLALMAPMSGRDAVPPGGWLEVDPLWARWGADPPSRLAIDLVSSSGRTVRLGAVAPSAPGYPPGLWRDRELARARHRLRVPADVPAGDYRVHAVAGGRRLDIGAVTVASAPRTTQAPALEHPAEVDFGTVRLLGYEVRPSRPVPGRELQVTLAWRAESNSPEDAAVFVHLYDDASAIVAQHDGVPADGSRPLAGWLAGEVVTDVHRFVVPSGVAEGQRLRLAVGLYDPVGGERRSVVGPRGERPEDRAWTLTELAAAAP